MYSEVTGKKENPIAIGGGTYARALKCGCAFGPEINGEEATIHQANEYVTFDRIRLMSDVYYNAIKAVSVPQAKVRIAVAKLGLNLVEKNEAEANESEVCDVETTPCKPCDVCETANESAGTVIGVAKFSQRLK